MVGSGACLSHGQPQGVSRLSLARAGHRCCCCTKSPARLSLLAVSFSVQAWP